MLRHVSMQAHLPPSEYKLEERDDALQVEGALRHIVVVQQRLCADNQPFPVTIKSASVRRSQWRQNFEASIMTLFLTALIGT